MPGPDVVRCNQYKTGVVGDTRISKKYLIKYGCFGNQYEEFEHLKQLWMGIWQHTHTVTTTEVSPDLGKFTEILDDVSVVMIPVRYH